ncbi:MITOCHONDRIAL SODIUM/CALCIUM EXCHANGER PROTEIN [Salix purpurea]|uniref:MITOCHONDRIAL SODIUM/CALCIUM EXCHANGER PROTEIN n=1 Tax=Salix purpurea TaxID=77065 RepID=A0A9Q1A9G1_SALPP|nr:MITOCHONDRIAL SODIUM/CALCIUM EXCHANGER PROTEIN [Salix purpurea]
MGGVTLLALGNGAPDVFASLAAVRSGQYRTGFGAILSAGTFVSAFVVGFVAIYAAPFNVDPASFIRDVGFYLLGAGGIAAAGGAGGDDDGKDGREMDCERGGKVVVGSLAGEKEHSGCFERAYGMISKVWEFPVSSLLKLTIPQSAPLEWNRFYISANIALCPVALLYACNSFMPLDHPILFLFPNTHFPLWFIVFSASSSLAVLHFILEKEPPKNEQILVVLVAFVMSVFWISAVAGELLNCLEAVGILLEVPPSLLGLTVLAWGNSVGDLVADVAVAKAGQPAMAMAGCFAGPMFNMLVGLGSALVILTADVYPKAYRLHFHISIVIAFVFLLFGLMGSLLVITWSRFRVPRFWGFCLVGLYVFFVAVSLVIAMFSG